MANKGKMIYLSDLMQYPIRLDHYDKVNGNEHFVFGIESVLEYAENLPTVDAVEVVYGRWMPQYDSAWIDGQRWKTGYYCSSCMGFNKAESHYCPNCGAKMDLEVK